MTERDLQDYIEDLEYRLQEHADALNESIEQRDRLAIDAAWGVASRCQGATFAGLVLAAAYALFPHHWITAVVAVLGAHVAYAFGWMKANDQRMKEVDRLYRLPGWQRKRPG